MRDLDYKAAFLWAVSGTTGLSAKALVQTAFGLPCEGDYPHDGGDFGRCERAMEMIPGLRDHLPKMVTINSYWAALVPEWDRIKASKDQYRTIQSIIRPREAADANHVRLSGNLSMRFGRPK